MASEEKDVLMTDAKESKETKEDREREAKRIVTQKFLSYYMQIKQGCVSKAVCLLTFRTQPTCLLAG